MATKKLSTVITIGGAVTSTLKSALSTTKSKLVEVGGAVRKLEREQRNLSKSIETFGKMGKNVDGLRARYATVTAEIDRQKRALERLKRVEDARQRNLANRKELRGKIGDTATFGAAVILPAGMAVKRSADFNYQLQAIGNTADMTRGQVAAMGLEILKISDDVGKSAQTTQGALGYLVAAGMEVGTARGVLRSVGRTSTATASEIEDVAKSAFTLNDALKIQPGGMQRALDMLVQSGKEGNFEFKDMAAELPVLGAGLQSLKMTGTEAVATIGAALQIARKGAGSSQQAATNVENFLAKVLSPETLKKARKLNSDLYGVVTRAQKKGQNPFEAAIKEIDRITKGGDQKLLGELFQDMQVQNFLRPMLQNLKEYERIKNAALSADGVVDRDFIRMSETTKQQLDEMTNAVGRAAIAIGSSLEPAISRLATAITPVVRSITDFVNANQGIVGNTILVVGALTTLRLATLTAGFAWTFLKGGLLSTVGLFYRVVPAAVAASGATTAAAAGPTMLGRAFMFLGRGILWAGSALLMNPIGLAITAIAVGAYLIYKNWAPIKAFFKDVWNGISAQAEFAWGVVKKYLGWTPLGMLANNWDPIRTYFTGLWDDITATARKAFDWILGKIEAIGSGWQKTKAFFGFGEEAPKPVVGARPAAAGAPAPLVANVPPGMPQPPAPPQIAAGRNAPNVTSTQHNTFNVTQLPGENADTLTKRIMRMMDERNGIQRRSSMFDTVTP